MRFHRTGLVTLLWLALGCAGVAAEEAVWIDVRSALEHSIDSIDGDIRISHTEIVDEVRERFPDKDTDIQLYCRGGTRAGTAMSALQEAGYTRVSNAGGIDAARALRGISN